MFIYHAGCMSFFLMWHNLELLLHKCETEYQLLVRSINQVTNVLMTFTITVLSYLFYEF
jgi:hypothetical protein